MQINESIVFNTSDLLKKLNDGDHGDIRYQKSCHFIRVKSLYFLYVLCSFYSTFNLINTNGLVQRRFLFYSTTHANGNNCEISTKNLVKKNNNIKINPSKNNLTERKKMNKKKTQQSKPQLIK